MLSELNNYKNLDGLIHITIGFNGGFMLKDYIYNNEIVQGNYAFSNVLCHYLQLDEEYADTVYRVRRSISTISFSADNSTITNKLNSYLAKLFNSFDLEKFEKAKKNAKLQFERIYENIDVRAKYFAFEFSDYNKGFKLKQYIKDLDSIVFEEFCKNAEMILTTKNLYVYIQGDISNDAIENIKEIEQIPNVRHHNIDFSINLPNPYTRSDMHLLKIASKESSCSIITFDCIYPNVDYISKKLVAEILVEQIPGNNFDINIDPIDSSVIFDCNNDLLDLKKRILAINSEEFLETKRNLLIKYTFMLQNNPNIFADAGVEFLMYNANICNYMTLLNNISYKQFREVLEKADCKLSIGKVVFRKGGKLYV